MSSTNQQISESQSCSNSNFLIPQGFYFCPRCGHGHLNFIPPNKYTCNNCQAVVYLNTAAACAAILTRKGKILFLIRAKDPAKGKLDLPGGFIDPGESAETAVSREINEELGLSIQNLTYLGSEPNRYLYRDITYPTCDLIFTGLLTSLPKIKHLQEDEVSGFVLLKPEEINLEEIAFPSLRKAVEDFISSGFHENFGS